MDKSHLFSDIITYPVGNIGKSGASKDIKNKQKS